MKVRSYSLAVVLAAFTVAAAPALAQGPREGGSPSGGGGDRAGGGGAGNSGNAGGGGGGGSVAGSGGGGGSSSSSASGATFSSPSGSAATASNLSFGDRAFRQEAPSRRTEFAGWASSSASNDGQRAPRGAAASGGGNGSGSGDRAVPRSGSSAESSGRDAGAGSPAGRTRISPASESNPNNSAGAREVPNWSRPRGDRPVTGTAVERVGPRPDPDRDHRDGRYYSPYYYSPYYYAGYPGYYGYGSPYYPYMFGVGYGLYSGLGWNPYFGDAYDPYYSSSGGYSSGVYNTPEQGNLKLKVKPRNAKVYVDGFFVGMVDEFDGAFQKLALNSGRHKVEVRAEGYETAEFDVVISPQQTVTFQGELKRIQ